MKYFTTKINIQTGKKRIEKSLDSLLFKGEKSFFIFPFCLFHKSFYASLKERRKKSYTGIVNESEFEFTKIIYYGNLSSGQTSRQLIMKGEIIEKMGNSQVEIEFHLSNFDIIVQTLLMFSSLIAIFIYKNYLFVAIPIVILLDIMNFTLRNYIKIRQRLNKNNVP